MRIREGGPRGSKIKLGPNFDFYFESMTCPNRYEDLATIKMDDIATQYDAWALASTMALAMILAWCGGRWIGARRTADRAESSKLSSNFVSSKLSAYLGLLSLLLGFTFSMSLSRHERRILMVVADSNAIGDLYTCASLLKDPVRTKLQNVVREYAQLHVRMARSRMDRVTWGAALERNQLLQSEMTNLVSDALIAGTPISVSLTNTLNGLTSASASRLNAVEDRVPGSVVLLLFVFTIVTTTLDGFEQSNRGSTSRVEVVGILSFIVLVALVVYVTLDLDQPDRGLINVSQASIARLVSSLAR
jgi:hypothetical protein